MVVAMVNEQFHWECQPKAEKLIENALDLCCRENEQIAELQEALKKHTSSRLFDWLDHIILGKTEEREAELEACGFVSDNASGSYRVFHHPGAQLPRVLLKDHENEVAGIAVSVESIAEFLMVRGINRDIEGSAFSRYRRSVVNTENSVSLIVVERRGVLTMEPIVEDSQYLEKYIQATELWLSRPREMGGNDEEAYKFLLTLAEELLRMLGQDLAAWVVLECERKYWQARNSAGQIQKNRQDRLGMGWANHDHHTFRSSRRHFQQLIRFFEILGFHCRERFYAGKEAGWGAQVMENPRAGLVLFCDVDLDADEIALDFSHHALPEAETLGTIGLWCELHGDSIMKAGMHHLEAQFLHEQLTSDLEHLGIGMMDPFSRFPYLKQAFTSGEVWTVESKRIQRLLREGKISDEEAEKFMRYGAVGSHLENLERREGYKGFNQKNVSFIIKKTDPRHQTPSSS